MVRGRVLGVKEEFLGSKLHYTLHKCPWDEHLYILDRKDVYGQTSPAKPSAF
jgi:hypothetical protein